MTFQDYSKNSRSLIAKNLEEFLQKKKSENIPSIFKEQDAVSTLEQFVLRGKMVRGTLFLLTTEFLGKTITKEHLDIACAIELVHSALLIQDDIIDRDRTRRGGNTTFVVYEQRGEKVGVADVAHFGISIAIVVADVAIFLAMEMLSHYGGESLKKIIEFYSHEIYLVALAEGIDSEFGQSKNEPTKEDIYSVYKLKTARYTFSLPFVMACVVSGNTQYVQILEELGEKAGMIFQIKDDLIGLLGDEKTIGKPIGSDVRENKKTLIRALLYERCNSEEKIILDNTFGNVHITTQEIETVKQLVGKYQIDTLLENEMQEIMKRGWELFKSIEGKPEFKIILKEFLEFNLLRTY